MKTFIVDSFTSEPFKGNPAAVCILTTVIHEDKMIEVAKEFGFSETAFVMKTDEEGIYTIRFFSPKKEIPLCGHATLASAKVLFRDSNKKELRFITLEKLDLLIRNHGDEIFMEFPVYETVPIHINDLIPRALGLKDYLATSYSEQNKIILIEITSVKTLADLIPDFPSLISSYSGINGVLVTAQSMEDEYDYHYRYFWPWAGDQ